MGYGPLLKFNRSAQEIARAGRSKPQLYFSLREPAGKVNYIPARPAIPPLEAFDAGFA
jgi:hypothetical protein